MLQLRDGTTAAWHAVFDKSSELDELFAYCRAQIASKATAEVEQAQREAVARSANKTS